MFEALSREIKNLGLFEVETSPWNVIIYEKGLLYTKLGKSICMTCNTDNAIRRINVSVEEAIEIMNEAQIITNYFVLSAIRKKITDHNKFCIENDSLQFSKELHANVYHHLYLSFALLNDNKNRLSIITHYNSNEIGIFTDIGDKICNVSVNDKDCIEKSAEIAIRYHDQENKNQSNMRALRNAKRSTKKAKQRL